ncbi:MAG: hypothetical protein IKU15_01175 [Clostridia bacterium]|nr:hypothetical protein [Clostridia bacterium]
MRKDISTKILSVLFAIVMWFYIIQVQSPDVERTIKDIPVLFTQTENLENRKLMLLNDKEYTVDLKVRGQRKYIVDLNKSNVSVVADVGNINKTGAHTIYTNVVMPYGNLEVVNQRPSTINVTVDEVIVAEKEIFVETVGNPSNGYAVGEIETTPKKVKIKGAKSLVGGVDRLLATIDVSGRSEDILTVANLEMIGITDKVVDSTYVTLETDKVEVRCEILKKKTVSIEPKFEDSLIKEGYSLDESSLKSVEIAGAVSAIEKIDKVETTLITKEMIKSDATAEVEIVLPSGVELLGGEKITLKLKKNN